MEETCAQKKVPLKFGIERLLSPENQTSPNQKLTTSTAYPFEAPFWPYTYSISNPYPELLNHLYSPWVNYEPQNYGSSFGTEQLIRSSYTTPLYTALPTSTIAPSEKPAPLNQKKKSWSRAVFSSLQRKGLEKQFSLQKYITKPDRRKLAESLGLSDSQVKVWFQNRRMKWRHSREYIEEHDRAMSLCDSSKLD